MKIKSLLYVSIFCITSIVQAGCGASKLKPKNTKPQVINYHDLTNVVTIIINLPPSPSQSTGPEESAASHPFGIAESSSQPSAERARRLDLLRQRIQMS